MYVSCLASYQPPPEMREEEQRRVERERLEAEAALWWDPLRVMEEERKRELLADEERWKTRDSIIKPSTAST